MQVDRNKFFRLLSNLLSNALKFTPDGGVIEIAANVVKASADLKKRIPEQIFPGRDLPAKSRFLQISVRDSGVGIPKDALLSVFDRFEQVKTRRMGKTAGSGLGLTFCRKVMDVHHGFIWAESEEGKGSTFFLLFPLE
jgi:signal transduction histidine kinase